jgi:hypothetical protein
MSLEFILDGSTYFIYVIFCLKLMFKRVFGIAVAVVVVVLKKLFYKKYF